MITILTGVPGVGKTAKIVDMIMADLKDGRKVYTFGIPDLLLPVHDLKDPQKWHTGEHLKIGTYHPVLARELGLSGSWIPRECCECKYKKTCTGINTNKTPPPDSGAVVYIDEAHQFFKQRASGKEPPPWVEALTVHRHQGIDMVFITQRPTFMDPFVRGLASRHLHLMLNPFSLKGARKLLEWAEFQENINAATRAMASKKSYLPPPHVFPLYKSATVHTKLDRAMPNVIKAVFLVLILLAGAAYAVVNRVNERIDEHDQLSQKVQQAKEGSAPAQAQTVGASADAQADGVGTDGEPRAQGALPGELYPRVSLAQVSTSADKKVDSCIANATRCQCYTRLGQKVVLPDWECRQASQELTDHFDIDRLNQNNQPVNPFIQPAPPPAPDA